jgi:hypothetical protein
MRLQLLPDLVTLIVCPVENLKILNLLSTNEMKKISRISDMRGDLPTFLKLNITMAFSLAHNI